MIITEQGIPVDYKISRDEGDSEGPFYKVVRFDPGTGKGLSLTTPGGIILYWRDVNDAVDYMLSVKKGWKKLAKDLARLTDVF